VGRVTGGVRSLEDFERSLGVSLASRSFTSPGAVWAGHDPDFFQGGDPLGLSPEGVKTGEKMGGREMRDLIGQFLSM
jgi:hypothetical protein